MPSHKPERYALISVFDKTGIAAFAKTLVELDYQVISTGGTAKFLAENGVSVLPISNITGNPESFDGRIKTISFQVEAGILFDRDDPSHVQQAKKLGIKPIDVVVCNVYPFEKEPLIENIDVGGPTMIRAAAKNYEHVLVIIDPKDYSVVSMLLRSNRLSKDLRRRLAAKAFAHLSYYDTLVAQFFHLRGGTDTPPLVETMAIPGRKISDLRYGENPHQQAALYVIPNAHSPFERLTHLSGRELSLTNVIDINAGIASVRLFKKPCSVIIKHASPCGIALGRNAKEALTRAIDADPESAFGGVVTLNVPVDRKTADVLSRFKDERRGNIDIIAAPTIKKGALELLSSVRKSMGLYVFGRIQRTEEKLNTKWVDGGFILQTADTNIDQSFKQWEVATKKKPTKKQCLQMQLAWKFISRIRSNAVIVVDRELPMTRGIGTGQTSRVRATRIALEQAGEHAKGAVLASDSFFPFPDSVELAQRFGISAIVQQGGSVNDKAVTIKANRAGIAMVFTHRRAFWH